MPRLAVLMPVRDAEATVERAVRSTLAALPDDAELAVADDGSTDGTLPLLQRLEDPRLRVLSWPGRGVARTLNALLAATDSETVARMDADDVVLPGRFRRQLHALGSADVVFTTVAQWHGSGIPRPGRPVGIPPRAFAFHLLLTNPVAHSTMAARREVVSAGGGYREAPSEDYDLWLRLAARGARIRRLPLPSLLYRVHPGQVTAQEGWRTASWLHEGTQHSFDALSDSLLGAPLPRISALAVLPLSREEKSALLGEFERRFRAAIRLLPPGDRWALERLLARRASWLRDRLALTQTQTPAPVPATAEAS